MERLKERCLFRKKDLPLFLVLFLLAAGLLLAFSLQAPSQRAVVEREGEILWEEDLSLLTGPKEVALEGAKGISLVVRFSPEGAQVLSAQCPDQVCVKTGLLTRAGEAAVCLPGRLVLRMEGANSFDAQTY